MLDDGQFRNFNTPNEHSKPQFTQQNRWHQTITHKELSELEVRRMERAILVHVYQLVVCCHFLWALPSATPSPTGTSTLILMRS